jgi:hypothetical protein
MADIGGIAGPGGWRVEIEMKREGGKKHRDKMVIDRQTRWREMIESLGGIYIQATNEIEAVEKLKAALKERRSE